MVVTVVVEVGVRIAGVIGQNNFLTMLRVVVVMIVVVVLAPMTAL